MAHVVGLERIFFIDLFIFRHSQDKNTPQCPPQTTRLQDGGYSFMGMQGDTYAAHQDLGKFIFFIKQKIFLFFNRWFW